MPDSPEPIVPAAAPPRFSRRGFLVGTSVVAVGASAASVAGFAWLTQGPRIDLDALAAGPLTVGYIEGSGDRARPSRERWIEDGSLAGARVIPAGALRNGDASLAGRPALLTVHGLYPGDTQPEGSTLAIDVHVASSDPTAPYPFHAWLRRGGSTPTTSGRSNFRVLLDRDPRLAITVELMTTTGMARTGTLVGLRSGPGVVTLRPGAYLLGLERGAWDRDARLPAAGSAGIPASILLSVEPLAA